jgi:tRNA splicing ligase
VVQECRGLILDESANWRIVAFPYTKFFNYGEEHAASIDWSTACVQEKLDGSLMYCTSTETGGMLVLREC